MQLNDLTKKMMEMANKEGVTKVMLSGFKIRHIQFVPPMGDEPGYIDLVG